MSVKVHKRTSPKQKDHLTAVSPNSICCLNHAASVAFFFLRQPSKPNVPSPPAKSGSAAGSGVAAPTENDVVKASVKCPLAKSPTKPLTKTLLERPRSARRLT